MLCLTMLFVSCDQLSPVEETTTVETTQETTEEITTEAAIEDVEVDYSSIIKDWNNNLEYKKPESTPVLNGNGTLLFETEDSDYYKVSVQTYNTFILVTRIQYNTWYSDGGVAEDVRTVSYEIYNAETGSAIRNTYTVPYYKFNTEDAEKTFDFNFLDGIFELKVGTLKYDAFDTDDDPITPPQRLYYYDYSYSYYDHNGKQLASGLKESDYKSSTTSNGDTLIYIADKCYLIRDHKVFYTFDKGQERPLPYVDFEYLDYKYSFDYDTVRVFDGSFNLIAQYTDHYDYDGFTQTILDNGNVYIQYVYQLDSDAKDYDFAMANGEKFNVKHVILDVATGKATELELGFVVENLISNADNNANMIVKNNNQFAEVYKFAEGKLAADCSFLILDNNMAEVAELPKFLKNQCAGTRFTNTGKLVVAMNSVDLDFDDRVYYSVDLANNKIELSVNVDRYVELGDDAFAYNKTLYSADLTEIYDLSDVVDWSVFGDSLLVTERSTDSNGLEIHTYKVVNTDGTENIIATQYLHNGSANTGFNYSEKISCYVVQEIDNINQVYSITVYNSRGEKITGSDLTTTIVGSSDKGVTIKVRDSIFGGYTDYYYFFKY